MNAKIGSDSQYYERVIGKNAISEKNDYGERLCNLYHNNELVIAESNGFIR
jgi:hypothetical protein